MNRLVSSLVTRCAKCGSREEYETLNAVIWLRASLTNSNINVFPHALDHLVGRGVRMVARIEIQLFDDVQQPRPAQNLLRNALHALLQIIVHVRGDVILRHGGLLHQDQGGGLVAGGQNPADSPNQHPSHEERDQK